MRPSPEQLAEWLEIEAQAKTLADVGRYEGDFGRYEDDFR